MTFTQSLAESDSRAHLSTNNEPVLWTRPYYATFHGIRGLAILMVFLYHYADGVWPGYAPFGLWSGVDLFFVLSGFLITGILFDARREPRYFRNFWIRRGLRILPVAYGFYLLVFALKRMLHLQYGDLFWTNPLYISNFFTKGMLLGRHPGLLSIGVPHLPGGFLGLGALWSLCVEEQFYLLWPVVIRVLENRKTLLWSSLALVVVTLVGRVLLYAHDPLAVRATGYYYFETYTRCDSLLVGACLALWLRGQRLSRATLHRLAAYLVVGSLLLLGLALRMTGKGYRLTYAHPAMSTVGFTLTAICAGGVLLYALDETTRFAHLLRSRVLTELGRVSYGFYFFHGLYQPTLNELTEHYLRPVHLQLLLYPLGFALTFSLAELSFRFVEKPFLSLKDVLAPASHPAVPNATRA